MSKSQKDFLSFTRSIHNFRSFDLPEDDEVNRKTQRIQNQSNTKIYDQD